MSKKFRHYKRVTEESDSSTSSQESDNKIESSAVACEFKPPQNQNPNVIGTGTGTGFNIVVQNMKAKNEREQVETSGGISSFFTRGTKKKKEEEEEEEEEEIELLEKDTEDERTQKNMMYFLRDTIKSLEFIMGRKYSRISTIEGGKTFKSYLTLVLISLIIAHIGFIVVTIIQVFIPTFEFPESLLFILVLVGIISVIWIFKDIFVDKSSSLGRLVGWFLGFTIIAIYYILIFILSTHLSWISMLIIHLFVNILEFGSILLIYFTRFKLQDLRIITVKMFMVLVVLLVILLYLAYSLFSGTPAIMNYVFFVVWIAVVFKYIDQVVEMFKGVTGTYDKLSVLNIFSVLVGLTFIHYLIIIVILNVFKTHGFVLLFPKPFPNWYWEINIPSSWFNFF